MGLTISRWDHPRIRGEHQPALVGEVQQQGSSPHTRGALLSTCEDCVEHRIIPAYAGSTGSLTAYRGRRRDHPRIRGEHGTAEIAERLDSGSSPHTRGARGASGARIVRGGIIPAYAGSTLIPCSRATSSSDHPRIRGEHAGLGLGEAAARGSSPHTRGAPILLARQRLQIRIIPAYAGSTSRKSPERSSRRDHPRIRGEHDAGEHGYERRQGSSPHTRGAHDQRRSDDRRRGIIPAYAGSTRERDHGDFVEGDHPRIRGEHQPSRFSRCHAAGSSPHTRGARRPQGAGGRNVKDHPRIRGEHSALRERVTVYSGSSPHTRGARPIVGHVASADGIIPAYAGSTT